MHSTTKRRLARRYQLLNPLRARLLLRSLGRPGQRGVEGVLVDASRTGVGVLVQENVALDARCVIEVYQDGEATTFRGEVCYATRTDAGVRLGILLSESGPSVIDFLEDADVEMS